MGFTTYPDAAAVEALIRSAGYWPTDPTKQELARIQAEIGAAAARDEWERVTGWEPFLAGAAATARTFNATDHTGFLDFEGGALSVQSVAINGQPALGVTRYQPQPQNAVSRGQAFLGIQMARYNSALLNTNFTFNGNAEFGRIEVVARWGRVAEVPGDVYQAILQKAALVVLTQIENLQSVASISQDGFSKAYDIVGIVTQKDLAAGGMGGGGIWGSSFDKIAQRWVRVVC
ncbi:MAG: hypothetical protein KY445_11470 [Armatimonadetes bacterium]|nr:hypothetical protein [Armatimonadota bacterium]